ncbi:type III-B CRISPR module RAMP protein Cmr4 [Desulfococcus sp.]|uniref:type III-B CRISPR module RAMP protein Cmr4 n=1 Tax=Desulfococcus sp. TaxID=2025834 RepID=UPI0035944C65
MLKKELCAIGKLYAISPAHAGSGAATSAVDLPIQRERHTEWPQIQASGVKGAFRNHFRRFNGKDQDLINLIFGSDVQDGWAKSMDMLPGAVSISDARLLAFPVRSNIAPFIWVTCPAVLKRLNADLAYIGFKPKADVEDIQKDGAFSIGNLEINGQVILEDAVVNVITHHEDACIKRLFPELERLLLVSDEIYRYAVTCCTEVQTHIKIDEKTGTADDGALWYQEYLPADCLLYTLVHYSHRNGAESGDSGIQAKLADLKAATIRQYVEETICGYVQIGGDETLGKGIFELTWMPGGDA